MDYNDVINTSNINDMIDTIKALEALSEGILTTSELLAKIDIIFSDEEKDGICLSTIHKAKGLEADNVYILCRSLIPSKYARKEWEIVAEDNLLYVALTRAKKRLNYISEKLFPANLFGDNSNLIDELEVQRNRMNEALKIKSKVISSSSVLTRSEQISVDAKRIMNKGDIKTKQTNDKKRKSIGGNKFAKLLK